MEQKFKKIIDYEIKVNLTNYLVKKKKGMYIRISFEKNI